jgi:flagellar FliL protein
MPDDVNDELVAEEAKSSKLPMILGVLATFIVGGAVGFGGSSFMGGGDESADSSDEGGEKGKDGDAAPTTCLFNLGLFTVNLRGTGGGRVVRMEIQVVTQAGLCDGLEERKPEFRHAIITMVSDYSYNDLEGLDGKTRLADELLTRLNRLMDSGRINRLYFVQFVVQ